MNLEYWFRSRVEIARLFGGVEIVENIVRAHAATKRQARARARYKVWREAREAGYPIGFRDVKIAAAMAPTGADNWAGVIW